MPVAQVQISFTDCTPAKLTAITTLLAAHPDTIETNVDAYDGPLAGYTANVTCNFLDSEGNWSAAKNTAFKALLDELSA